jgi:hypothetical protein
MGNQSVTQNNLLQYFLPPCIILLLVVDLRRKIPVRNGKDKTCAEYGLQCVYQGKTQEKTRQLEARTTL